MKFIILIITLMAAITPAQAGDFLGLGKYANEQWGWNDKKSHRFVHGGICAGVYGYMRSNNHGFIVSALSAGVTSAVLGEFKEHRDKQKGASAKESRKDRQANWEGCGGGVVATEAVGQVSRLYITPVVAPDYVGAFFKIEF